MTLSGSNNAERSKIGDDLSSKLKAFSLEWQRLRDDPNCEGTPFQTSPIPYPGLRSFTIADSEFLFGRDGETEELAARLQRRNILSVLGGSGSGKSSAVLAGLLPYLKTFSRIPGREGRWYLVDMRPGTNPVQNLVDACWDRAIAPLRERKFAKSALMDAFPDWVGSFKGDEDKDNYFNELFSFCEAKFKKWMISENGSLEIDRLLDFVDQGSAHHSKPMVSLQAFDKAINNGTQVGPANLLLVFDQFEEIFRKQANHNRVSEIVKLIKTIHDREMGRTAGNNRLRHGLFIALTMRSEELHRCAEHQGLSEIIIDSAKQIEWLIGDTELKEVIIEPARLVLDAWGIPYNESNEYAPFSKELVDLLIEQHKAVTGVLLHKADSLPLLQHALREIWNNAVEGWLEEVNEEVKDDWAAKILNGHFESKDEDRPLQSCLDHAANKTVKQILLNQTGDIDENIPNTLKKKDNNHKISNKKNEVMDTGIVAHTLVALARSDDNKRWIRQFSTSEKIAELSDSNKERVETTLAFLVKAGYLFHRDAQYDVSHEALIRNWGYYITLLTKISKIRDTLEKSAVIFDATSEPGIYLTKKSEKNISYELLQKVDESSLTSLVRDRWPGETWARHALREKFGSNADGKFERIKKVYELGRGWPQAKANRARIFAALLTFVVISYADASLRGGVLERTRTSLMESISLNENSVQHAPFLQYQNLRLALARYDRILNDAHIRPLEWLNVDVAPVIRYFIGDDGIPEDVNMRPLDWLYVDVGPVIRILYGNSEVLDAPAVLLGKEARKVLKFPIARLVPENALPDGTKGKVECVEGTDIRDSRLEFRRRLDEKPVEILFIPQNSRQKTNNIQIRTNSDYIHYLNIIEIKPEESFCVTFNDSGTPTHLFQIRANQILSHALTITETAKNTLLYAHPPTSVHSIMQDEEGYIVGGDSQEFFEQLNIYIKNKNNINFIIENENISSFQIKIIKSGTNNEVNFIKIAQLTNYSSPSPINLLAHDEEKLISAKFVKTVPAENFDTKYHEVTVNGRKRLIGVEARLIGDESTTSISKDNFYFQNISLEEWRDIDAIESKDRNSIERFAFTGPLIEKIYVEDDVLFFTDSAGLSWRFDLSLTGLRNAFNAMSNVVTIAVKQD